MVNTFPAGASCTLLRNGQAIAAVSPTPGIALVRKTKYEINVVCSKPGYVQATAVDHSGAAASIAGDILVPGVGWAIDSASGADNKYQSPINLTLAQAPTPAAQASTAALAAPVPTPQLAPPAPQNASYYAIALPPGVTPQMVAQPAPVAMPQTPQMIYYAISAAPPQAAAPQPQITYIPMMPSAYAPAVAPPAAAAPPAAPVPQPQALLPSPAGQQFAANLPAMRLVRAYPPGTTTLPQQSLPATPPTPVTIAALPSR